MASLLGREVRGRGLKTRGGKSPPKIRRVAEKLGLSLEEHRAVQLSQEDVDWADLIVYMDEGNLKRLREGGYDLSNVEIECLGARICTGKIVDPNYLPEESGAFSAAIEGLIEASRKLVESRFSVPTKKPH